MLLFAMMLMMMREKSCGRGTRYLRSDAFIHQTHLWLIVVARTVNIHTKKAKKKRERVSCAITIVPLFYASKKKTHNWFIHIFSLLSA